MEFSIENKIINLLDPDDDEIIILKPDNQVLNNSNLNYKLIKVIDLLGNLSAKVMFE
jgi:hypothetical protein